MCYLHWEHHPVQEELGTEEAVGRTAEKEDHLVLNVSHTAELVHNLTDLLVLADRTVLVVDRIGLDLAVDQVGLKGVGILHNRHSAHQTDLAGHVLVPAVHTAVAVGQVEEDQKEEHIHPADRVGHRQGEHTGPIGV